MQLEARDRIVFVGDSITDCGRERPVGEGLYGGLGNGYVSQVAAMLTSAYPQLCLHIMNTGIGGNQIRDLKMRWQHDVLDLKPDRVFVLIGINDVWRWFDTPSKPEWHVPLAEFQATYAALIEKTLPAVKGMTLMTPFYLEPNQSDPMRAKMDAYGQVVKELAAAYRLPCVDLQQAFDAYLQQSYTATIAADRVHPNQTGCMIITRAVLQAIGFAW